MKGIGAPLGVALLLSAVAGCGGQGGGDGGATSALPSVTRSVTRTPVQPSITRSEDGSTDSPPSRSARPSRSGQAPKPSEAESARPGSADPEPAQPSATGFATTITSTPSSTQSAAQSKAAATTDEDAAVAAWVWWLLGLLVAVALLTGVVLVRRQRTRADWSAGLADALGEASWLSNDLIPSLQEQSGSGRSGVWAVGRDRVLRLEQTLAGLVGRAPDDVTARHCTTLTSVVRSLRQILDQPEAAGVDREEASRTAIAQAQRELDETIAALRLRGSGGEAT